MGRRLTLGLGVVLLAVSANAAQDTAPAPEGRSFLSIWNSDQVVENDLDEVVQGGTIVSARDWPAAVMSEVTSGSSRRLCSAALIGPQALLTAAHCSPTGTSVLKVGPTTHTVTCQVTDAYPGDPTQDVALCHVVPEVTDARIQFERVSTTLEVPVGKPVLLTGFGCEKPNVISDRRYRIAPAPVTHVRTATAHDFITQGVGGLCYGDSGGPGFAPLDANNTRRVLIGVNARGTVDVKESNLTSLAATPVVAFLDKWRADHGAQICGVDADTPRCRPE
jgi:hypothetical protein